MSRYLVWQLTGLPARKKKVAEVESAVEGINAALARGPGKYRLTEDVGVTRVAVLTFQIHEASYLVMPKGPREVH